MGTSYDNVEKRWTEDGSPSNMEVSDRLDGLFQGFSPSQQFCTTSIVVREPESAASVKEPVQPEFEETCLDYWYINGARLKIFVATVVPENLQNSGKNPLTWSKAHNKIKELKDFGGYDGLVITKKELEANPERAVGGWIPASDGLLRRLTKDQVVALQGRRCPVRFELLTNSL